MVRSEVRRACAVMAVLAAVFVLGALPDAGPGLDQPVKVAAGIGVGCIFALQVGVLARARWACARKQDIPVWFVAGTVAIESVVPSGLILWHVVKGSFPPFAALLAPPVLINGLLITLTTLRLRPWLCVLGGTVCAASHAGVLAYVTHGLGIAAPTTGLPYAAYINTSVILFITGLAAAWVTREIRGHMEAALSEAETRHRMARIEQDLSVARSIQRALLPREIPGIPGFDIAGWNQSADQTGGDYYDWQALPDGNWMVTLADVSGHGIGPALVTAACRAYVRASSFYDSELASLASRMNRLLAQDLPEGRFVTMATVLIDPAGGPLRLLSAGHGPIVVYIGTTGLVQDILPQDLPLAVLADATFGPAISVELAPGDVLALVTDGFVEWTRPGPDGRHEPFGLDRLRESLRRHVHLPALQMIEAVAAEVKTFARGEPQQDDLTMVVVKRVP